MKFRAVLTERGSQSLCKAFLPTLEKFGKTCHILLGPEEVHFVQQPVDADGANLAIRFAVERLFQLSTFRVQSRHFNLIAFAVDVGLLLKVLRSASSSAQDAETLDVKLTQRNVAVPGTQETEAKPFLCFTSRGDTLSLVQDLPIGKPCTSAEIDSLVAAKDVPVLCPWYLDLASTGPRLPAVVDKMKALSSVVQVAVCKNGDLHIQVAENSVMLGAMFSALAVYPQDARDESEAAADRQQQTAEEKLHQALEAEAAVTVHIQVKHLIKILSVSQLSQPSRILFGIAEGCGHVHVMYVYRDPSRDAAFDETIAINFKLPVRDED